MNITPTTAPAAPTNATAIASRGAELSRHHDALEDAARRSPAAFEALFTTPPPGLSAHEILPDKTFTRVSSRAS